MTVDIVSEMAAVHRANSLLTVSPDRCSGRVGDRAITGDNPAETQRLMTDAAYEVLHSGQQPGAARSGLHPLRIRDHEFENQLLGRMPHRTTPARGIVRAPAVPGRNGPPGTVLVDHGGIRVWVPLEALTGFPELGPLRPGTPVDFTLSAIRPALSPGFFLADSSRGGAPPGPILRVYVHLTAAADAPLTWGAALDLLEAAGARYRAKILSTPRLYPRRDALVVYLPRSSWSHVGGLVERLGELPGIDGDTSLFVERLAPGIGCAFEPDDPDPRYRGRSFGQHRCAVLVEARFRAAETGADVDDTSRAAFTAARIDVARPFRNIDSPIPYVN